MFSKDRAISISQISVALTQSKLIYSQIESARTKVSVMRLITFINNQHIPRLYQDHLNRSGCVPMAESNLQYTTAFKKC